MKNSLVAVAAAALAIAGAAAQEFPSKPLRIIVPNPPGGTVDIVARTVGQRIAPALGRAVLVEPHPGADTVIGTDMVARAAPDGHTILLATATLAVNPIQRKLPYDGVNGFVPVALLVTTPNVIAVHPSVKARSLAELIALARDHPGEINLASGFQASSMHLAAERLQQLAGVRFNYIPYQGAVQAALAAASGHAQVVLAPLSDAAPHIASGKLLPLAVTSAERFPLLKDVPTVAESGFPGFQSVQWFGAVVPAGTPRASIAKLSAAMQEALEDSEVRATFAKIGLVPRPMGPESFAQFIQGERVRFATAIREANVKIE